MRIGFLCAHNPFDRNAFSGTAYYALQGLERFAASGGITELRVLGTHRRPVPGGRYFDIVRKLAGIAPHQASFEREADLGAGLDWIISLVSTDLALSVAPKLKAPLAHVTDATPQFLREFYGYAVPKEKDVAEAALIDFSSRVVFSSDFMRQRAIVEFGEHHRTKMRAISFGVNLDRVPQAANLSLQAPLPGESVELLFIGKEWERKGGPLALEIISALRRSGTDARLTIVGCDPQDAKQTEGVTIIPFLDKNDKGDGRRFDDILDNAHLFLLPTRADCTPMVIAEANAHSLPAVVTGVGGVGSLITEGRNGKLLPLGAEAEDWADVIRSILSDSTRYEQLRSDSFSHFQNRLNWSAWTRDIIADLAAR
jgi:glycosyltransferase involved in cell wall biosynthesis